MNALILEIKKFEKAVTKVTAILIAITVFNCVVTASAEQTPKI